MLFGGQKLHEARRARLCRGILTNTAQYTGGGFYLGSGTLSLSYDTLTANRTTYGASGGGIYVSGGQAVASHSIIADNYYGTGSTENDIVGALDAALSQFNLIGTGGSGGLTGGVNGNQVGVANPGLTTLGFHGGRTRTHALLSGSLAIDAGNPAIVGAPSTDQRGKPRIADGNHDSTSRIDIGAFELAADEYFGSI